MEDSLLQLPQPIGKSSSCSCIPNRKQAGIDEQIIMMSNHDNNTIHPDYSIFEPDSVTSSNSNNNDPLEIESFGRFYQQGNKQQHDHHHHHHNQHQHQHHHYHHHHQHHHQHQHQHYRHDEFALSNNNNNEIIFNNDNFLDIFSSSEEMSSIASSPSMPSLPSESLPSSFVAPHNRVIRRCRSLVSSSWNERFQELIQFRELNDHCFVPHNYPENPRLSQWVRKQRHQRKRKERGSHSTLSDERQEILTNAGFIWDSHKAQWYERYQSLEVFQLTYGHCNVPSNFQDSSLSNWVKNQRKQYRLYKIGSKTTMDHEKVGQLNMIGFNWNPRNLGVEINDR